MEQLLVVEDDRGLNQQPAPILKKCALYGIRFISI